MCMHDRNKRDLDDLHKSPRMIVGDKLSAFFAEIAYRFLFGAQRTHWRIEIEWRLAAIVPMIMFMMMMMMCAWIDGDLRAILCINHASH